MRLHRHAALGPVAAPPSLPICGPRACSRRSCDSRPIDAEEARDVSELRITLDVLSPAERRDLANALLRAAWSAVLEETRILLLDLLLEADDTTPTDVR
jgi:hypothetical protein